MECDAVSAGITSSVFRSSLSDNLFKHRTQLNNSKRVSNLYHLNQFFIYLSTYIFLERSLSNTTQSHYPQVSDASFSFLKRCNVLTGFVSGHKACDRPAIMHFCSLFNTIALSDPSREYRLGGQVLLFNTFLSLSSYRLVIKY